MWLHVKAAQVTGSWVTRSIVIAPGVQLAIDDWATSGVPVLFLHATGFSRGVWRPMCDGLLRAAPGSRPIAIDLRGHGASSKPPAPYRWSQLVDDIESLYTKLGLGPCVVCGHSVGGATAVEFAVRRPEAVTALVLVEAPLRDPVDVDSLGGARPSDLIARTERRRWQWPSHAEACAYLRARSPYDGWDRAVFEAWTDTALANVGAGVELSCPPWVEASVFAEARGSRAVAKLPNLRCPVWLGRGTGTRGMPSTTSASMAMRIPRVAERIAEGDGHFAPLERVNWTVEVVAEAVRYAQGGVLPADMTERPGVHRVI